MLNKNSVFDRIRILKWRFLIFLFVSKVLLILANIRLFAENLYSFGNRVDVFHNLLQMLQDPWNWTNTWPRVKNFYSLTSLGSNYFSEIFSPSHIKLTNNNLNKDFKSVK